MITHSASGRATGTDSGYPEASRSKKISDEALLTQCYNAANKELKINDLTELPKQNTIPNKTCFSLNNCYRRKKIIKDDFFKRWNVYFLPRNKYNF